MTSTLPPLVQAFSGAVGSATANAVSYPLDLVTTRLQTTKSKRLQGWSVLKSSWKSERLNAKCYGQGFMALLLFSTTQWRDMASSPCMTGLHQTLPQRCCQSKCLHICHLQYITDQRRIHSAFCISICTHGSERAYSDECPANLPLPNRHFCLYHKNWALDSSQVLRADSSRLH